jgi:RNA polymerase sigma-B factor
MKVPRYLQEIAANLNRMEDELYRRLQREPSITEMAEAFQISEEDLLRAMDLEDGNDSLALEETVGTRDLDLESIVENADLRQALSTLDERRQKILQMRFADGCSQQEVADALGLSQMHISRLERSALQQLRQAMWA